MAGPRLPWGKNSASRTSPPPPPPPPPPSPPRPSSNRRFSSEWGFWGSENAQGPQSRPGPSTPREASPQRGSPRGPPGTGGFFDRSPRWRWLNLGARQGPDEVAEEFPYYKERLMEMAKPKGFKGAGPPLPDDFESVDPRLIQDYIDFKRAQRLAALQQRQDDEILGIAKWYVVGTAVLLLLSVLVQIQFK